ncbi:hypothetical protein DL768_005894 [Monosporascus sp. mg162]|nr:hypothetical protein DL768_005894 [Monosporascus sp. mg162]
MSHPAYPHPTTRPGRIIPFPHTNQRRSAGSDTAVERDSGIPQTSLLISISRDDCPWRDRRIERERAQTGGLVGKAYVTSPQGAKSVDKKVRKRAKVLRRRALDGVPLQRGARYRPSDILDHYEGRPKVVSKLILTFAGLLQEESPCHLTYNIKDIEKAGAIVQVVRGDATPRPDVEGLFQSMTYENWKTVIDPKILGVAYLDSMLVAQALDFFLMKNSVSGVFGNPTQSNYAVANSYLDSLPDTGSQPTRRLSLSVLPMVLEVGVVAKNSKFEQSFKRKGTYGIDEEHLLQGFETAVISSKPERATDRIVVGLDPAKLQKAVSDVGVTDSFWLEDARLSHSVQDINSSAEDSAGGSGVPRASSQPSRRPPLPPRQWRL